ncbi:Uncharacterised protein [uncultured Flavonifractor sp.]|nr:Uncharacterised protein [uncultured Flavonifractor sp.]
MQDYKTMYFYLFNAITDALDAQSSGDIQEATRILTEAQCHTEELFLK